MTHRNIFITVAAITGGLAVLSQGANPVFAQKLQISKQACNNAVRHVPAPNGAYKPGVDVYGRKIVPADIGGGSPIQIPKIIEFEVTRDLRSFLGGPQADAEAAAKAAEAASTVDSAVTSANQAAADALAVAALDPTNATLAAAAQAASAAAVAAQNATTPEAKAAAAQEAAEAAALAQSSADNSQAAVNSASSSVTASTTALAAVDNVSAAVESANTAATAAQTAAAADPTKRCQDGCRYGTCCITNQRRTCQCGFKCRPSSNNGSKRRGRPDGSDTERRCYGGSVSR
jgi:hypothetical protein